MKMPFSFLIVFLVSTCLYSQPYIAKNGVVADLSESVSTYCTLKLTRTPGITHAWVGVNDGMTWSIADKITANKIDFKSTMDVFNFMDKSGWQFVNNIIDAESDNTVYLFEKKKDGAVKVP